MKPSFPTLANAQITQKFNNHSPLYLNGQHKGLDIGVPANSPVYACLPGVVETATTLKDGYGRHIIIRHADQSCSIYGHLNKIMVNVGQTVESGQQIALSGGDPKDNIPGDGHSTGAHLHWEIRPPGANSHLLAVDPEQYCLQFMPAVTRKAVCISDLGLNVRATPATGAQILYTLERNQIVQVVHTAGNWEKLHALREEWAFSQWLRFDPVTVTPPTERPTVEEMVKRLWEIHPELHK